MTVRQKIFLAHAREDKAQVRKLHAELKARGFEPWLDEVDLMPGQIWKVEIPKAIRAAGLFLACLSSRSVEKVGYVQNEFRLALTAFGERPPESIYLIPVRLDDCEVPDLQIPDRGLGLRDIHWVDLWQDGGFDRLVVAIEHALGQRAESLLKPGAALRDVEAVWCPELVVIPSGEFMMGSTEPERRWAIEQGAQRKWVDWERPQHRVAIPEPFAAGKYPVTRGQFAAFVEASDHDMVADREVSAVGRREPKAAADWCLPGFEQTDRHPVVAVSWTDAKACVEWLSRETGHPYRLLSESEWEYACRAGKSTRYSWGDDPPTPERANFGRLIGRTSQVGSYPPNAWGLHDMLGNTWEWVEDCWNESYLGAPGNGEPWTRGNCERRVMRGGAWYDNSWMLRAAFRLRREPDDRDVVHGFRVGRTLTS